MKISTSSKFSGLFPCLFLAFAIEGCVHTPRLSVEEAKRTRPLPEVPANDKNISEAPVAKAFVLAPAGHLSRTFFQTEGPPGYRVELQDLSLAPKKRVDNISFPGAAFLDVRYGSGILTLGDHKQELSVGSSFSVSQGQSFSLESTGEHPLSVRAFLIGAQ